MTITERKSFRWMAGPLCLLALGLTLAPQATADSWDKKTIVTSNVPIEVPGKVLPPGTYVFKLLDVAANRDILQIFDKDEKHLQTTILAVPDYRLQPSDKPIIAFEERPSGSPEALKAFFYPGDNYGLQVVYPHKRAVELAKRTNQNVLSMIDSMAKHMAQPNRSKNDASAQELEQSNVSGVASNGESVGLDAVVQTKPEK